MSNYVIMRSKKLKNFGSIGASLSHCFRTRQTDNADPERMQENQHLRSDSAESAMGALKARLPQKRRKDAVLAVEYVMTASPEWFERAANHRQAEFFSRSVAWLEEKYGAENVVVASIHRDEKTPHLSAFVVPLTLNKKNEPVLNANKFIGNKKQMSDDQSSFANRFIDLGLQRGIQGSVAKHTDLKEYYSKIKQPPRTPQISEKELEPQVLEKGTFGLINTVESPRQIIDRVNNRLAEQLQPVFEKAKAFDNLAETRKNQEKQIADLRETAKKAEEARKEAEQTVMKERQEALSVRQRLEKMVRWLQDLILFGGAELEAHREKLRQERQQQKAAGQEHGR